MSAAVPAVRHEANRYCDAKKHQGEGRCRKPAGWGTPHVGIGPCKLHCGSAGAANITHGLHSRYTKAALASRIEAFRLDPEPLNIGEELATARAYLADYLERHEQLDDEQISAFSKLLENVTKTVARIEKIRSENAISRQDLMRMVRYMTECMEQVVQDTAQQDQIKTLWLKFRYGAVPGGGA